MSGADRRMGTVSCVADRRMGTVSCVDDVLITQELSRRPSRAPDYEAESRALGLLAQQMATNPGGVLQKLVETVLDLCRADSAGVSILEPGGESGILRWRAVAGAFAASLNGTMPREASPCGTAMARDSVLLFDGAERCFPALRGVEPRIHENLLAPWHVNGEAVGALWAIGHDPERRFDAEDARLLQSLARFAAAAYQTISALEEAEAGRRDLERRVEERTRDLSEANDTLREGGARFRSILEIGTVGAVFFDDRGGITDANDAFLRMTGFTREEALGKSWKQFTPEEFHPASLKAVEEVTTLGESTPYEKQYFRKDGSRWWGLFAARRVGGEIVEFVLDITERKRAEEALREAEERQAFLLRLSDALRPLADPAAIQGEATRSLRERFDVGWCYYIEFDDDLTRGVALKDAARAGLPSLAMVHDTSDIPGFFDHLRSGRMLNVPDFASSPLWSPRVVEQYSAMGVRSVLGAPLVKNSRLVALLLMVDTEPRAWPDGAATLLADVADRTWAALERARAERALRESEEKYRTLFASMDQGFCIIEKVHTAEGRPSDFRYLTANPAFERHTGLRDVVGRTIREVVPDPERGIVDLYDEVVRTGLPRHFEAHVSALDLWMEAEVFPARMPGQIAVLFSNVSNRKRAEAALRESEERFRRFADASSDVLWIRDAETLRFEYLSPAFEAVYGADRAEVLGDDHASRWAELVHPEDREEALGGIDRLRAGERVTQEFRVLRPSDGEVRWVRDTDFPMLDDAGRVAGSPGSPRMSPSSTAPRRRCARARSGTGRCSTPSTRASA
ncbi:MAG: PAS domain S-box protein [Chloroflexota bacterium]|nr:PAS domain S-box protein [Chloroflexota bacterium]